MSPFALAVIAGAFALHALHALVSRRLASTSVTGPMLFVEGHGAPEPR